MGFRVSPSPSRGSAAAGDVVCRDDRPATFASTLPARADALPRLLTRGGLASLHVVVVAAWLLSGCVVARRPPAQMYAVVKSARAHARVTRIDVDAALALPGVVAWVGPEDIPEGGVNWVHADPVLPLFASGEVSWHRCDTSLGRATLWPLGNPTRWLHDASGAACQWLILVCAGDIRGPAAGRGGRRHRSQRGARGCACGGGLLRHRSAHHHPGSGRLTDGGCRRPPSGRIAAASQATRPGPPCPAPPQLCSRALA